MNRREGPPICPICNKPVELVTAKTTEDGKAIHDECYIEMILQKQPPPEPTDPTEASSR
jgi:hypothetical protein